jgi:biopolymer transport protein ExbB/TolQ
LERGLITLEITVGIAPLLGLVGTAFGTLGQSKIINSADLAKGIGMILTTTLLGLLTAIPALVAWNYYSSKVQSAPIPRPHLSRSSK